MSNSEPSFGKGDRVEIVRGRQGVGVKGRVFWTGPNKYGPGDRLGVQGDDGRTYWTASSDVGAADKEPEAAPAPAAGPSFDRGDRVSFSRDGAQVRGEVFWTGQSRNGPGQRLGVRVEGEEEPTWIDASRVRADTAPAPAAQVGRAARAGRAAPSSWSAPEVEQQAEHQDEPQDEQPADWAPALGMDDLPPAPPISDALIDAYTWDVDEQED